MKKPELVIFDLGLPIWMAMQGQWMGAAGAFIRQSLRN